MGLGRRVSTTSVGGQPTLNRAITSWAGINFSSEEALLASTGGAPWEISGQSYIQVYRGILSIPGAWRAATLLAGLLGSVPWKAYTEDEDDELQLVKPTPPLLKKPAPPDTRVTTFTSMALDLVCEGNAIALKVRNPLGVVTSISPQPAAWCGIRRDLDTGQVTYSINGHEYDSSEVLHIKGVTVPGQVRGMGVLEAHFWTTFKLAHDLNRQARDVSINGVPTGVLEIGDPDATTDDMIDAKTGWQQSMSQRTIAVVGANSKFTPLSWNPTDAQLIEARQFSLLELALIFGLPPSFLGASSGGSMTYTNTEQEATNLLKFSMNDHLTRMEAAISDDCFEDETCVKADLDAFLRSDTLTRYQAYMLGIDAGWLLRSEVRKAENKPPKPGIDDAPQTAATQLKLNKTEPVTSPAILQPRDPGGVGIKPNVVYGNDQGKP